MSITPISKAKHYDRGLGKLLNFKHASFVQFADLGFSEVFKGCLDLPFAIRNIENNLSLVAILSLHEHLNVFSTKDGAWIGGYIPIVFQEYPLFIARNEKDPQNSLLCIDETSDRFVSADEGTAFFDSEGKPSEDMLRIMDWVKSNHQDRQKLNQACQQFKDFDMLRTWELSVQIGSSRHDIEGLLRIDEDKLNTLEDKQFIELRRSGALTVAYCQLLSMSHIRLFDRLYRKHEAYQNKNKQDINLGKEIFNESQIGDLNFNVEID